MTAPISRLAALAESKKLPLEFLHKCGLSDDPSGIRIPYKDLDGSSARSQIRTSDGGWFWDNDGNGIVPYGSHYIQRWKAKGVTALSIGEGVTDALTMWFHKIPHLGLPGNKAGNHICLEHVDWVPTLFLTFDNDEAGDDGADNTIKLLREIGYTGSLFRTRPRLKDISDDHCSNPDGFNELWEQLKGEAVPILAPNPTEGSAARQSENQCWPTREAIAPKSHDLQDLPIEIVPAAIQERVNDIRERMGVPVSFVALPLVTSIGSLIGRRLGVAPEPFDDWYEVPNIWAAIISDPGTKKTPAQNQALEPLEALAELSEAQYEQAMKEHRHQAKMADREIKAIERRLIKARHDPLTDIASFEYEIRSQENLIADVPIQRRYITNDATVESQEKLFAENPTGLLLVRDELMGWLRDMDKPGHEKDRAKNLESWGGKTKGGTDRISRDHQTMKAKCLSIIGNIQPGPLSHYVREANNNGTGADGLLQRFQLLVTCLEPPPWELVRRKPNLKAAQQVKELFAKLDTLDIAKFEPDTSLTIPVLRLSDDAQTIWDEWRKVHEALLRSKVERPAFKAFLSKQDKTLSTLALIFHVINALVTGDGYGPISERAMILACAWVQFFEIHARWIYGPDTIDAAIVALSRKIEEGQIFDNITVREIKRKKWGDLRDKGVVDAALQRLAEYHWIRIVEVGRESQLVRIHPDFWGLKGSSEDSK